MAALNKCEGVTLIEERGYRPQARTYDYLRFHIAAFWRCLVNELRSLCLGVGLVVYPKEIPATATETPQISTETAETVNVSAEGEKEAERPQYRVWRFAKPNYAQIIVSDYSQWKVVAVLSFVWGKTQIEAFNRINRCGSAEVDIQPHTAATDARNSADGRMYRRHA